MMLMHQNVFISVEREDLDKYTYVGNFVVYVLSPYPEFLKIAWLYVQNHVKGIYIFLRE